MAIKAFSLIEVMLAMGVVGFAFVALFGMLPVGLKQFSGAVSDLVTTQIAQEVLATSRQANFTQIAEGTTYYDEQGKLLAPQDPASSAYSAAVTVSYFEQVSMPLLNTSAASANKNTAVAAIVKVIITKVSSPQSPRTATAVIANNGIPKEQ
jgi:uncharacterized protein (TIGR02598 family)